MHQINYLLILFILVFSSCRNRPGSTLEKNTQNFYSLVNNSNNSTDFELTLTSGILQNQPINKLREIPLSFKKIYLFVKWKKISTNHKTLNWQVINPNQSVVFENSQILSTKDTAGSNSKIWYNFNRHHDKAGSWLFKVWLDDDHIISYPFKVLSIEDSKRINSADWLLDNFIPAFTKNDSLGNSQPPRIWKTKTVYYSPLEDDEMGCVRIIKFKNFLRVFFLKETDEGAELYEAFQNGYTKFIDDIFVSIYDPLNNFNLIGQNKKLYYFTDNDKNQIRYFDLETNSIKNVGNSSNPIWSNAPFKSLNGNKSITKNCATGKVHIIDSLLNQKEFVCKINCNGNYGSASWINNNLVYFDLDPKTGGIWEYSTSKKELNRIILANNAKHPYQFLIDSTSFLAFINRNTIKIASNNSSYTLFQEDFDPKNANTLFVKSYDAKGFPRLKINLQRQNKFVLSYSNKIESGDSIFIYEIGKTINTDIADGILYRADRVNYSEKWPSFQTLRFVKKGNKFYFLKNASSGTIGKSVENSQLALHDPYFELNKKDFFNQSDTIIMDGFHRIEAFSIPKNLIVNNHPAHIKFYEEIPGKYLNKIFKNKSFKPESNEAFASVPGATLPEIYYSQENVDQYNGAFWVFRRDNSALIYEMNYDFRKTFFPKEMGSYDNYSSKPTNNARNQFANIIPKDLINLEEFKSIGFSAYGDSLYFPKNLNHFILKSAHKEYLKNQLDTVGAVDSLDDNSFIPFHKFVNSNPLFIWKDPVGRYIQFTHKNYFKKKKVKPQALGLN